VTVRRVLLILPAMFFLFLVTASGASADDTFGDVNGTGHDAVKALVAEGVVQGCDDHRFCATDELTRGQVATILTNALDLAPAMGVERGRFSDTEDNVHAAAIDAVAAVGLSSGCGDGRYCPDEPITRAQLASMLQKGFGLPDAPEGVTYFRDVDGVHAPAVAAVAEAGISNGCDLVDFCARENLQRIHAAMFFARALDLVERQQLAPFDERKQQYEERLAREKAEAEAAAQAKADAEAKREAEKAANQPAAKAVEVALAQLGKPYRWGGSGPHSFDCSGLTSFAWAAAGVTLPRSSRMQYGATARISRSELKPGDLVFYHSPISHVAMYIGDGKVVEAPNSGNNVRIRNDGLTRRGVVGFGRVRP
jgi:cell wall-associated NlpC family hydrolase